MRLCIKHYLCDVGYESAGNVRNPRLSDSIAGFDCRIGRDAINRVRVDPAISRLKAPAVSVSRDCRLVGTRLIASV